MPLPTVNDVHVDQLLTNVANGTVNEGYVAEAVFPSVPVQKQSNVYLTYNQSYWFRDEAQQRAPGTISQEAGYGVTTTSQYVCQEFSLAHRIPDEVRANADAPFNLDRSAAEFLADKIAMKKESKFASDFFTTGVWTTDKTGGTDFTVWSNYAGSNPLVDLASYRNTVQGLIAKFPNVLVLGNAVWLQLKNHPDLLDTIKYTQRGQLSADLFASLAEFDKVLIGNAITTTTKEGTAEASVSYSRIWGSHALMVYVPASPSLMAPAAGYTFVWNLIPNANNYVMRHRDDRGRADIIEAGCYFDQKQIAAATGLFMSGAVA